MAPPFLQELELFSTALYQTYILNYLTVVVFTILLYDTILTLSREIEFIWKRPFSVTKGLYLLTRYYGLVSLGVAFIMWAIPNRSLNDCRSFLTWFSSAGPEINEVLLNLVLFLWIYAIYGLNKKLLYLVFPLYLIESGCVFYGGIQAGKEAKDALRTLPFDISVPGCALYVRTAPSFRVTMASWVPALVMATLFFGLLIYKVHKLTSIFCGSVWNIGNRSRFSELMKVIFVNGVIIYFANAVVSIVGLILLVRVYSPFAGFVAPLEILIYAICGCHPILDLHEVGNQQLQPEVTDPSIAFTLRLKEHVFSTKTDLSETNIHKQKWGLGV